MSTAGNTSDKFHEEYNPDFVDKWDDLIDWERRAEGESDFFFKLLRDNGCERILDAASGTGYHSITLAREGFNILAADGAQEMVDKTRRNAEQLGVELETTTADWRWLSEQLTERFDALLCLGNAYTHLFTHEEREQAMTEFYKVLKPGGIVVIDQRNYDSILDRGFSTKHKYYYAGEGVDARPEEIEDTHVRFRYTFDDGQVHFLTLFPIRQEQLRGYMFDAGFRSVDSYGDFVAEFERYEPDFLIHVGTK